MPIVSGIDIIDMKGYTTAQVAKAIGVSKNTLLQWLYAGRLREPKRVMVGAIEWRMWTGADVDRARKVKTTMKRGPKPRPKQ